jgi:hypothetical protein
MKRQFIRDLEYYYWEFIWRFRHDPVMARVNLIKCMARTFWRVWHRKPLRMQTWTCGNCGAFNETELIVFFICDDGGTFCYASADQTSPNGPCPECGEVPYFSMGFHSRGLEL